MWNAEEETEQEREACCLPLLNSILQHAEETGLVDTDNSSPTHSPDKTTQSRDEEDSGGARREKGQWKGREGHLPAGCGTQLGRQLAIVLVNSPFETLDALKESTFLKTSFCSKWTGGWGGHGPARKSKPQLNSPSRWSKHDSKLKRLCLGCLMGARITRTLNIYSINFKCID